ncbi:MAG: lytic murein transglycosylase [Candidatus Yanofskybacteria bacterium]|nr:lytic murein transglycosylase [Candidatus Yanofskybacteria bacterium]
MSKKNIIFVAGILAGLVVLTNPLFANASVQEDIETKNKQIEELRKQIEEYQQQIDEKGKNARSLSNEISIINSKISQIQTEVRSLGLSIEKTSSEIEQTLEQIKEAEDKIAKHRSALSASLRLLDQTEQENLIEMILKNENFSSFFNNLNNLQVTQESLRVTIENVRSLKKELEEKEESLNERKGELEDLRQIQQIEKRSVEQVRSEKNNLLKTTKGEEAKFQSLLKKSQADIEKIRAQIFYLEQNGVSAEEAVKYAQLAAIGVGIRPAFLLGILEVESGLGKNVGTGNWLKDMYQCYLKLKKPERAEQEKNAFFAIVTKLGLNPDTVKVSREPNYGCGGALGPAQFIPTTWLGYEADVARLTGHNPPNPWNVEDAFTASAIKLGRAGATAKTRASEIAAAKAYISGKPSCSTSTCNYYANSVLRKAEAIEKNL